MAKDTTYTVRLKPYNRKRGFKMRTCFHRGKRYKQGEWHSGIPEWLAKELGDVCQTDDDEKLAFDVMTDAEAQRIEEAEEEARMRGKARAHAHAYQASQVRGAAEQDEAAAAAAEPDPAPEPEGEPEADPEPEPEPEAPAAEEKPKPKPRPRRKTAKKGSAKSEG